MKFKKFFIIGIFLMLMLLCIACASAGDVNDTTLKTGTDTIKSTDLNGAATDNNKAINADNEIIGVSSENDTKSKDNIIASSQDNNKLGDETPRTFTQLRDDIAATEGNVFNMQYNYKYDASADRRLNVNSATWITKQVTINGNGHIIEGSTTMATLFTNVLRFNDVYFKNFGQVSVNNDCNFTDCNFTGQIYLYTYSYRISKITNCNFFNMTGRIRFDLVNTNSVIENCSFKNISTSEVLINTINIKNCSFENISTPSELIRGVQGGNVNTYFEDCRVINCNSKLIIDAAKSTTTNGRSVVNNCIFINNTVSEVFFGTPSGTMSGYSGAVVLNNSAIYLNKNTIIFNSRSDYCSAFNNTIIAGDYSMDSDVEDSVINFNYSGLSSSVSASRSSLVTSKLI